MSFYSFKEFLQNRRIFVALKLSESDSKMIDDFLKGNNLKNNLNHDGNYVDNLMYHMTLWYSKTGHSVEKNDEISPITLDVENWELLGKNKEHLTLKMKKSNMLNDMKSHWDSYGLTSDWPSFKPHMTCVYHYKKSKIPKIKPPKTLTFDRIIIEDTFSI